MRLWFTTPLREARARKHAGRGKPLSAWVRNWMNAGNKDALVEIAWYSRSDGENEKQLFIKIDANCRSIYL